MLHTWWNWTYVWCPLSPCYLHNSGCPPTFFLEDHSLLNVLFEAAVQTYKIIIGQGFKGPLSPGIICVLHTFSRSSDWNPHVHCLATEGDLTKWGLGIIDLTSPTRTFTSPIRIPCTNKFKSQSFLLRNNQYSDTHAALLQSKKGRTWTVRRRNWLPQVRKNSSRTAEHGDVKNKPNHNFLLDHMETGSTLIICEISLSQSVLHFIILFIQSSFGYIGRMIKIDGRAYAVLQKK